MAELGSALGLISLSIQACQILTSYCASWRSFNKDINQIHRDIDEFKAVCENLELELQSIPRCQENVVQQVFRLIISCRDEVEILSETASRCDARKRDGVSAKVKLFCARALYPFTKQELQSLKEAVSSGKDNLRDALGTLQLYVNACSL